MQNNGFLFTTPLNQQNFKQKFCAVGNENIYISNRKTFVVPISTFKSSLLIW